jgi:hypothetical protein
MVHSGWNGSFSTMTPVSRSSTSTWLSGPQSPATGDSISSIDDPLEGVLHVLGGDLAIVAAPAQAVLAG